MTTSASSSKPNLLNPIHLFALGFGSGLSPWAPGTVGTLVAAVLWWFIVQPFTTPIINLIVVVIAVAVGIPVCGRAASDLKSADDQRIVWDEFCGFWLTILILRYVPLGTRWIWFVIAFALFRLLDIFKPWPIGWIEKKTSGGVSIVLDDLVAGALAMLLMYLLSWVLAHFFGIWL